MKIIYYESIDKYLLKDGDYELWSTERWVLEQEMARRKEKERDELLGKIVKPKEESFYPKWTYTHKCRYEIMDEGKHKGGYVVRSLQDRSKYWFIHISDLIVIDEAVYTQVSLFES